ncbi:hypothetical protein EFY79_07160 [Hanamia caeni]|jgi:dihydrofolate reductase|uniref:Bacterial bifunctional deaminase-reductase C-terminal domain-containing protein n=1 Tax=Hanamia caeni TaxID=2294116 RepID=A0A3M9NJM5_9BACT|nr:dihydrofolate reductase family protein [Hanamia caeni]RNI38002.1 hypothetical protein EFY79_07160 [Hanamia caeni]
MKVICVFVATLDGKITKWNAPRVRDWTSQEDQKYYKQIWNDFDLIVMGSNTYLAEKFSSSPKRLLLVMTRHPSTYKQYEVPGQIEFTDQSPEDIVTECQQKGYKNMIMAGGPHLTTSFFQKKLIDELWLTIEPKIFGTGGNLVIEERLDIDLQLLSIEKVNKKGTLITKYAILR